LPPPGDAAGANATLLHLTETAQRAVPRDQLRVDFAVEVTDPDAAKVQAEINRRMSAALARIKAVPDVTLETTGYNVFAEHPDKKPAQWHGSQSISLTAGDFTTLLTLAGTLQQEGLVMRGLTPQLSRAAQQSVEDELTDTALARLRKRAERIAAGLGVKVERFRGLTIGNASASPPPMPLMRQMTAAAPMPAPPPVAEPGEATVSITAQADILLTPSP
jgi:predicted secreted protein